MNIKTSGLEQKIFCGVFHTLAIKFDSTLWAWGNVNQGQVGNGNVGQALYPVQVSGLNDIIDAAGGYELKQITTFTRDPQGLQGTMPESHTVFPAKEARKQRKKARLILKAY